MIIKVNYTISNPIIKITYDETPIYVSTTSNPIYVSVNYGGTSSGGSGTVTSVGLSMPNGFTISGSPITTSGTLLVTGAGTTSQYLRGDGTLATFPTIGSGTVTSVGLSMPSAFTVSSSPITTSGSISVTGSGTTSQYIRGDGTLATFPSFLSSDNLIKEVYNESGATMTKGTVVYINGSHGNLPTIAKALATSDATSAQTLGMVQTDIGNMSNGYIVIIGNLIDMDTQAYANGTQLYLSGTTAGGYTSTKQYAPIHLVYVGIVVRSHPTQGIISVKCQNGFEVDEIHNLSAQNPSNNDGIFYNTSTSLWENKSIVTALGYTPYNATNPSGYISGITSGNVTTALGYTPVSSNIYSADGTLASARSITHGGFNLSLIGSSYTNRFTSAGRLLLGTTTENSYLLDVNGSANIGGTLYVTYPNSSRPSINFATSGTLKNLPVTGDMEMDGTGKLYFTHNDSERGVIPAYQFFKPNTAITLVSQTAAQPIFNTITNGAVTLKSATNYIFEMLLYITNMSSTSGTFGITFGGSATLTSIAWQTTGSKVNNIANTASHQNTFNVTNSNATLVTASAFTTGYMRVWGNVRINAGGTFIPQITLGIAAAATINPQSYFRIATLSASSVDYIGNWS